MEVFSLAIIAALIGKAMSVLKSAVNKDWNTVLSQGVITGIGWAAVALAAHTSWASTIVVQNISLSSMNAADLLFLGAALAGSVSQVYDFRAGLDNTQSAAEPKLLKSPIPVKTHK